MVEERWRKEKARKKKEKTRKMGAKIWPPTLKVIELLSQLSKKKNYFSFSSFLFFFFSKKNHEEEKGRINFQEFFWSGLRIKDSISNSKYSNPKFSIQNFHFQFQNSTF